MKKFMPLIAAITVCLISAFAFYASGIDHRCEQAGMWVLMTAFFAGLIAYLSAQIEF